MEAHDHNHDHNHDHGHAHDHDPYRPATPRAPGVEVRAALSEANREDGGASAGGGSGAGMWRSLDELADTPEFRQWVHDEFPGGLSDRLDWSKVNRRQFLTLMGASFVLASLAGCSGEIRKKIVPYVQDPPDELTPGKPLYFATSLARGYEVQGVLVESHMGRPTKVEGNPDHPASLGATDLFTQAEVLGLCDPDRSQGVRHHDEIDTWEAFSGALSQRLAGLGQRSGSDHGEPTSRGLRLLTGAVTSPSQLAQIGQVLDRYPGAKWHVHEPIDRARARAGARQALGQVVDPVYRLDRAKVILSLDGNFLFAMAGSVRYARDFAEGRRMRSDHGKVTPSTMNRLYVVEPTPTITGAKADHRLALTGDRLPAFAAAVARELKVEGVGSSAAHGLDDRARRWASVVAKDLHKAGESALVVVGESQPPEVHALGHAINATLGSLGHSVEFIDPVDRAPASAPVSAPARAPGDLAQLTGDMHGGKVDTLIIVGTNPVYDAPADLPFAKALARVPHSIHMGLYRDETARQCAWHVPMTHALESWGDARGYDGTVSMIQPLIDPLYGGKSPGELWSLMLGRPLDNPHDRVRAYWRERYKGGGAGGKGGGGEGFEDWWKRTLRRGMVKGSASPGVAVSLQSGALQGLTRSPVRAEAPSGGGMVLELREDPTVWDGRYANNAWLQEIPDPLSKLAWGNAALMSPKTAKALGVEQTQVVEIEAQGRKLRAGVWLMPGQAEGSIAMTLGYGRLHAGKIARGAGVYDKLDGASGPGAVGVNVYPLRTTDQPWTIPGIRVRPIDQYRDLTTTQNHQTMEGRDLFRVGSLEEFKKKPEKIAEAHPEHAPIHLSLYPEQPNQANAPQAEQQWGMSIDLTSCIGCNACTVACQSENNIAVVGAEEVRHGREMHWIRIDRYFEGSPDDPDFYHQPIPCMHCEDAPCEVVCPVGATQHSEDGLNEMVYNRCIGTRYCSNNCPYKVRRFNFLQYAQEYDNIYAIQKNPDVSVRARGVMEKCTYCVQRIREAQITAQKDDRHTVTDGEIVTACQQVCPTQAITFGDIADKDTAVSKEKAQPHDYNILEELNTRPRTSYLAEVRHPNPALDAIDKQGGEA